MLYLVSVNDDTPQDVVFEPENPQPQKPLIDYKERNKELLRKYINGIKVKDLAAEYGINETRVYAIINKNKGSVEIDKEFEKSRRIMRLKQAEQKAPANLAPKDVSDLVKVIEAQRKELEGDGNGPQTVNNTINITQNELNVMPVQGKWEELRKLLESE